MQFNIEELKDSIAQFVDAGDGEAVIIARFVLDLAVSTRFIGHGAILTSKQV
ncbi:MAG: hypothetical protein KGI03_03900 [Patescibacteria group bacterium]|nr:hypothetical protein [Patescibacteria group bacterium]